MSIRLMSAVFDASPDVLNWRQKLVMLALTDHANDEGRSVYPSVARLQGKTGLSERSVRQTLKELRAIGAIMIDLYSTHNRATEYSISVQFLEKAVGVHAMHPRGARGAGVGVHAMHPNHHSKPS